MKASTRVLRLLTLLQAKREWSGEALAEKLGVDVRTVRRDADRLRELGYSIDASSGPGGGYRLAAGASTPPVLLDDEEAVAVAVALVAAAGTVAKLQDVALRVLAKLDQILPSRLRRRSSALSEVTLSLGNAAAAVDLQILAALASACRDRVELRFEYSDRKSDSARKLRNVEPMRLVHTGRVWYLAAWDLDRADWRTFRVDRITSTPKPGDLFTPREPPEDLAQLVSRSISTKAYRYQAKLKIKGARDEVAQRIPPWVGVLEPIDAKNSLLTIGADTPEAVAAFIVHAGVEFTLLEPAELAEPIRSAGAMLMRGARASR